MLVSLVGQGFSYSQSATQINEKYGTGYSRNAAIGRANRIGLVAPHREKKPPTKRKYAPRTRSGEHHTVLRLMRPTHSAKSMRMMLVTESKEQRLRCVEISCKVPFLENEGCWYPDEKAEPHLFCGGEKMKGQSYCVPHFHLCNNPIEAPRSMPQAFERRA